MAPNSTYRWYVSNLQTNTSAVQAVGASTKGSKPVKNVGKANSASPAEPGVGLTSITVQSDSCLAQMSNCDTSIQSMTGATNASNTAFKVRNRAVQLSAVAQAAAHHVVRDMLRKPLEATFKSPANDLVAFAQRDIQGREDRWRRARWVWSGAQNKADDRSTARLAMNATPPPKITGIDPSIQDADAGRNASQPTATDTIRTAAKKNSSSNKAVAMTVAKLRPQFSPFRFRMNVATALPPTTEGVRAEESSQSKIPDTVRRMPMSPSDNK